MRQDNQVTVKWGGQPVQLTWEPNKTGFSPSQVTSVHGFCFYKGLILLSRIEGRGYNIPGGHVEEERRRKRCFTGKPLKKAM